MAKLMGEAKRKFLARMAAGRKKAGLVTGASVKRKKPKKSGRKASSKKKPKRAGNLPAVLPKRQGHAHGMIGKGTPQVRLQRVERAVVDLAKVNHAIVSKLVDHEKRINKVESIASQWARGRQK